jgi:hypothetical protein
MEVLPQGKLKKSDMKYVGVEGVSKGEGEYVPS